MDVGEGGRALTELREDECWDLLRARTVGREGIVREVAFEVDDLDPVSRSGWSVLVRGRRRLDPEAYGTTPRPEVWVGGSRWLVVRIEVRTISGRRLTSGEE